MILLLVGYSFFVVNVVMYFINVLVVMQVEDDYLYYYDSGGYEMMVQFDYYGDIYNYGSFEKGKNFCCKDYCGVVVIVCFSFVFFYLCVVFIYEFVDDMSVFGQVFSFYCLFNI